MAHEELSRVTETTVKTEVKYTFVVNNQSYERTVIISHFMPQNEAAITVGIENRYQSELKAMQQELNIP